MNQDRKILVAYDGSDLSKKAIKEAKNQVGPESVVHLVSVIAAGGISHHTVSGGQSRDSAEVIMNELDDFVRDLERTGIKTKKDVINDFSRKNPGFAICDYAEEKNIEQIIVGSRGINNLKKIFLGSVSTAIIERAKCDVLVVK